MNGQVYIYVDGMGGMFCYTNLSTFIKEKIGDMDVCEKTLRREMKERERYVVKNVVGREIRLVDCRVVQRKKVRPKYLFGKPY